MFHLCLPVLQRSQGEVCESCRYNYLDLQKTFIKIPLKSSQRKKLPWDKKKSLHTADRLTKGKWLIFTEERSLRKRHILKLI